MLACLPTLQADLITKGYETYGLKAEKSTDQIKSEIEPWLVPPVLISGFTGVPGTGSDYTEAEVLEKFKEAYAALPEDQKKVRPCLAA